jgi:radical SAM superfamily enzyme YgiQ (UPF0313 family)
MMSKILFIEPELRTDKLGLLYLAAVLRDAGHDVDLVQDTGAGEAEQYFCPGGKHLPPGLKPDFVMYSVFTGNHQWYIEKNRSLKEHFNFTSVFGGMHVTFFPEDVADDPAVDYVVRGPGEVIIADLVKNPPKEKVLMGTVPPDVNALPFPDRSILYKYDRFGKSRMKRFIACRDCMWACTYCFNHLYHRIFKAQKGHFHQMATPERVVAEIVAVRDEWGLELAYFNDDNFAKDHRWLEEFCDIFEREVGIQFCGSVRADSITQGVAEMMADAGCTFMNVALESAVPETQRNVLRRGRVTNADVANAVHWMERCGIKVRLQNMVGLPLDDPLKDALETLRFNQEVAPTDSWVAIFQPFPKTDAWQRSLDMGLIDEQTECMTFFDNTVLAFPEPTRERINRLAKWWHFAVDHKLSRETVLDLIDIPLTEEQKGLIQEHRWATAARRLYGM